MISTSTVNSILHRSARKVGINNYTPAAGSRVGLTSHYPVGKTSELKAPFRVPIVQTVLWYRQPRSTYKPNIFSILPEVKLSNLPSFDVGTSQVATKIYGSMDLSDDSIKRSV